MATKEELLSVPEVARMVGVSERQVRDAIHNRVLDARKVGASWAVFRDDADEWKDELEARDEDGSDDDEPGDEDEEDDEEE